MMEVEGGWALPWKEREGWWTFVGGRKERGGGGCVWEKEGEEGRELVKEDKRRKVE